jgi:hypothetical protein
MRKLRQMSQSCIGYSIVVDQNQRSQLRQWNNSLVRDRGNARQVQFGKTGQTTQSVVSYGRTIASPSTISTENQSSQFGQSNERRIRDFRSIMNIKLREIAQATNAMISDDSTATKTQTRQIRQAIKTIVIQIFGRLRQRSPSRKAHPE